MTNSEARYGVCASATSGRRRRVRSQRAGECSVREQAVHHLQGCLKLSYVRHRVTVQPNQKPGRHSGCWPRSDFQGEHESVRGRGPDSSGWLRVWERVARCDLLCCRTEDVETVRAGERGHPGEVCRLATLRKSTSAGLRFCRIELGRLRCSSSAATVLSPGLWTAAGSTRCGRKVRAPQGRVVGNAHRSQEQGKCHRNQTAGLPEGFVLMATARVKR